MALFNIEKKSGKNFLSIEISKGAISKLNALKKHSNDPKRYVLEVKGFLNGELEKKLTELF